MKAYFGFLKKYPKAVLIVFAGAILGIGVNHFAVTTGAAFAATALLLLVGLLTYWGYAQFSARSNKLKTAAFIFGINIVVGIPIALVSFLMTYFLSGIPFIANNSELATSILSLPLTFLFAYGAGCVGAYVSGREKWISYPPKAYIKIVYGLLAIWVLEFLLILLVPNVAQYTNVVIAGIGNVLVYTYAIYYLSVVISPNAEEKTTVEKVYGNDLDRIASLQADLEKSREEMDAISNFDAGEEVASIRADIEKSREESQPAEAESLDEN